MRVLQSFIVPVLLQVAAASHVHYTPPEIELAVATLLDEYAHYPVYHGPTGTATAARTAKPTAPAFYSNGSSYWLQDIKHQGVAAFNPNSALYQVFRNVKDFGAKGDGVTDDSAAINFAISSGNRCGPGKCQSSTITPAVVYFPAGTYLMSTSAILYYETQLVGNPNSIPILQATPNFTGFGLIDGSQYQAGGILGFGATNTFYRQVRNFVLDMTSIPSSSAATGIHWPTAQATSLQNILFKMSDAPGTQHQGLFIESGSGGFMNDLIFDGGLTGAVFGNQQFTMRNLSFYNAVTAINQIFDWGWTYKSITIDNCTVGLNMSQGGRNGQSVGSVTFFDSSISNVQVAFNTSHDATSLPPTAGSLIIENVIINNVPIVVMGPANTTVLAGTSGASAIAGWGQGHSYTPNGPVVFEGPITPFNRPASLVRDPGFYERSKPQYATTPVSQFLSTRSAGAKGDGVTDDTAALQAVISTAAVTNKIVFFDAGTYRVTRTLFVPPNSKLVGESYSRIMSSGAFFNNMKKPQPVVQVGRNGESGTVEWSDMIVSTQGAQAGAILIEWNLSSSGTPSGMWDVHTRIGGFAGSQLQLAQCPTTPTVSTPPAPINPACIAAYMSMHVTKQASNLYLENVWLWTADHDLDDSNSTQTTIYTGRGLYIESKAGTIWLWGTAVEHHALYQYQLDKTQNLFMGQVQTETAYYQPNPNGTIPFPPVASINDPDLIKSCVGVAGNCADGWGLRILDSQNILIYGIGLYSFFANYNTSCIAGLTCQVRIFDIEGSSSNIDVYNLNTIGTASMIDRNGQSLAKAADNVDVFPDNIALFRSD